MANKVGWKCIIPYCSSPARAPGHYFPKNNLLLKKWLEAISIPWISNLPAEEIRKCRICHLHFNENSYIFSLHRRRLKHNAIPNQNLIIRTDESDQVSQLNQIQEISEIIETVEADISPSMNLPSTSQVQEENITLENHVNIDEEQQTTQPFNLSVTMSKSSISRIHRLILSNITRKKSLNPIAKEMYDKCRMLTKPNNALRKNLISYKQRLKYATKFSTLNFWKKYSALSNTQKIFIDMQIKNIRKKPNFFKILYKN
ncbi:uncharacterized protein LOC120358895 [Solenopsis invicta]|uniref:uncharacterized protein LOC120358895 n=1 Tax=Solenopsis invicta TaxID=13686 RepID=UPI00193D2FC1|nr:uncharacterized protein LOC120358895 [Solenopsis invicta]